MQKNSQLDDVVSAQELIKRAQDLQPFLKSQAAISEANRSVTDESMQKLKEADLLRVCVPKRWGGLHISANTMGQIARELAKACPSTAWLFCISNSTSWVASLGPDAMQEEVFADGVPVMCSAVNPSW